MKSYDADTLIAFLQALAQQDYPLPTDFQSALPQIGRDLADDYPNAIEQIRSLTNQYPAFKERYDAAYQRILREYQAQERTKSLSTAAIAGDFDLEGTMIQVLLADEPIVTAKRLLKKITNQSASRYHNSLWERGDRVVALAAGGAFLGVLLAQIPGAIVGAILAAFFAWFTYTSKTNSIRNF